MNSKIMTSRGFKFVAFLLLTLASSNFVIAQTRLPQNVRRVITTFSYTIENGQQKQPAYVIEQELYDSLSRKHTDIFFDRKDHSPHNFKWFYYKGSALYKAEIYEHEKLKQEIEYTYTNKLISQQVIKNISSSDTSIYLILNYTNNEIGKPIKIVAKNGQGKLVYSSTSKYNTNGLEISRKVKAKKNIFPQDSIISLSSKPTYDPQGRLAAQKVKTIYSDKRAKTLDYRYSYDSKGNQTGILTLDENGKQVAREELFFHEKYENRVLQINRYGANNVLVEFITKRYEVYPSNNPTILNVED